MPRRGSTCSRREKELFPCKSAVSRDPPRGDDPPSSTPSRAGAVMVGEGHAPVLAVLLAAAKRQTSPFRTPKGVNHGPPAFSPAKGPLSGDTKGGQDADRGPLCPAPLRARREGVSSHQPSGSPPALSVVDSPFSRGTSSSRSARLCAPSCGLGEAWRAALTGAQLART
jgi:hypothetical protein